jgi:hypothetical protein
MMEKRVSWSLERDSHGHEICESPVISRHYESMRSQALAYLMTVGSKALVLMDVTHDKEEIEHSVSMRKSFTTEASIKRRMIMDEKIRQLRRMLIQKPGVSALKRGRNNKTRQILIRLKEKKPSHGAYLVWKSKISGKGYFDLETIEDIDLPLPAAPHLSHLDSELSHSQHSISSISTLTQRRSFSQSFIRLKNTTRTLDIQFETDDLTGVFVEMFMKEYLSVT